MFSVNLCWSLDIAIHNVYKKPELLYKQNLVIIRAKPGYTSKIRLLYEQNQVIIRAKPGCYKRKTRSLYEQNSVIIWTKPSSLLLYEQNPVIIWAKPGYYMYKTQFLVIIRAKPSSWLLYEQIPIPSYYTSKIGSLYDQNTHTHHDIFINKQCTPFQYQTSALKKCKKIVSCLFIK